MATILMDEIMGGNEVDISGAEKRTVKQGQFVHELELSP